MSMMLTYWHAHKVRLSAKTGSLSNSLTNYLLTNERY
jgi:hypothetical protein